MNKNLSFNALEFVRKVRNEHAADLHGKSQEEILAFFARFEWPSVSRSQTLIGCVGTVDNPASAASLFPPL